MAKVQNIPGIFGQPAPTDEEALAEQTRISRELGLALGIPTRSGGGFFGRGQTIQRSPSEVFGLAATQQLAQPSIFDQLGLAGRAQERIGLPDINLSPVTSGFGARTPSEQALLDELISLTGGASALRGLGSPTSGALAQNIAPTLVNLRQQDIQNQLGVRGQELQRGLGLGQLGINARGTELQGLLGAGQLGAGERGQNIQGLLDLAGLSLPQPVVSQSGGGGGSDLSAIFGFGASLLPLLCHVAEELFGVNDARTHFARFYCATHDNWFVRIYSQMSRKWAAYLNDNPDKKHIVQPIWEEIARLGYERWLIWQEDQLR